MSSEQKVVEESGDGWPTCSPVLQLAQLLLAKGIIYDRCRSRSGKWTLMAAMATGWIIPATSGLAWPSDTREHMHPCRLPSELLKGDVWGIKCLVDAHLLLQSLLPSREFGQGKMCQNGIHASEWMPGSLGKRVDYFQMLFIGWIDGWNNERVTKSMGGWVVLRKTSENQMGSGARRSVWYHKL